MLSPKRYGFPRCKIGFNVEVTSTDLLSSTTAILNHEIAQENRSKSTSFPLNVVNITGPVSRPGHPQAMNRGDSGRIRADRTFGILYEDAMQRVVKGFSVTRELDIFSP